MANKDLLFLGGLGAPLPLLTPWLLALRRQGYNAHPVPNSIFMYDPVTTFARSLLELSTSYESFDVLGISYGGNAALYAASLSPEFCAKIKKMVLVCAPLLGAPGLLKPFTSLMPRFMKATLSELEKSGEVVQQIREMDDPERIPFDLHFVYHERDLIAPKKVATLPGVGTHHALDFQWSAIPSLVIHQAASLNPKTLNQVLQILRDPTP